MNANAADDELGLRQVWVFHGEDARFASDVFAGQEAALRWIDQHQLTEQAETASGLRRCHRSVGGIVG